LDYAGKRLERRVQPSEEDVSEVFPKMASLDVSIALIDAAMIDFDDLEHLTEIRPT